MTQQSILERWKLTQQELSIIIDENPSVRGFLLGYVGEYRLSITAAVKVMRPDAADNGRVWPEVGDVVATLTTPEQNRALA